MQLPPRLSHVLYLRTKLHDANGSLRRRFRPRSNQWTSHSLPIELGHGVPEPAEDVTGIWKRTWRVARWGTTTRLVLL